MQESIWNALQAGRPAAVSEVAPTNSAHRYYEVIDAPGVIDFGWVKRRAARLRARALRVREERALAHRGLAEGRLRAVQLAPQPHLRPPEVVWKDLGSLATPRCAVRGTLVTDMDSPSIFESDARPDRSGI